MEYRTTWNRGYHIICLAVRGDFVILGDAMRSLEYLYWSGHTFKSVSKDHSPLWPLSLETLDDQTVMVGEVRGVSFVLMSMALTRCEFRRMETSSPITQSKVSR
jgi:hypothetical protein